MASRVRKSAQGSPHWVRRRSGLSAGVVAALGLASLALAGPARAAVVGDVGPRGGNGLIAFVADTGSGAQLFTVRANGHGLRQLTNLSGEVSALDWSPDGRSILYEHDLPDDQGSTLGPAAHLGLDLIHHRPEA